jgi:hypothetical protein
MIIEIIKSNDDKTKTISCFIHPNKELSFYCEEHDSMLCNECAISHFLHVDKLHLCTLNDVIEYNEYIKC